jgi:hypothetical protein
MLAKLLGGGLGHAVCSICKVKPLVRQAEEARFVKGGRRFISQVYGDHRVTPVLIHLARGGEFPGLSLKLPVDPKRARLGLVPESSQSFMGCLSCTERLA